LTPGGKCYKEDAKICSEGYMPPKPQPEDIAGGQALIEGVMMRHGDKIAAAVRRPDNEIVFQEREYIPLTKRYKVL